MTDTPNAFNFLRQILVAASSGENTPAAVAAREEAAAERARIRALWAPRVPALKATSPNPARSKATKQGREKRPADVAMAEIEEKLFPPWYRDEIREHGTLRRGVRETFAQNTVVEFAKRPNPIHLNARSILNNMPKWIESLRKDVGVS